MSYQKLLNHINEFKFTKILVSGPQRSGTTFLANALAFDLSYECLDESTFDQFINSPNQTVHQSALISGILHNITGENVLVIFISRNCNESIKSGDSLMFKPDECWNKSRKGELGEQLNLKNSIPSYFNPDTHSCYVKQNFWLSYQMHHMQVPFYNISYHSLSDCPYFVKPEDRVGDIWKSGKTARHLDYSKFKKL